MSNGQNKISNILDFLFLNTSIVAIIRSKIVLNFMRNIKSRSVCLGLFYGAYIVKYRGVVDALLDLDSNLQAKIVLFVASLQKHKLPLNDIKRLFEVFFVYFTLNYSLKEIEEKIKNSSIYENPDINVNDLVIQLVSLRDEALKLGVSNFILMELISFERTIRYGSLVYGYSPKFLRLCYCIHSKDKAYLPNYIFFGTNTSTLEKNRQIRKYKSYDFNKYNRL